MEEEYKSFFTYLITYAKNNNWVKIRKALDSTTLQLSEYYVLNIPEDEQDNLIKFLSSKFPKLDVKDLIERFVTERKS
jgi:hypothetical protein